MDPLLLTSTVVYNTLEWPFVTKDFRFIYTNDFR